MGEATWRPKAQRAGHVAYHGTGHVEDVESSRRRRRARRLHWCEAPWVSVECLPAEGHACQQGFQTQDKAKEEGHCESSPHWTESGGCGPGEKKQRRRGPSGAGSPRKSPPVCRLLWGSPGGAQLTRRAQESEVEASGGWRDWQLGRRDRKGRATAMGCLLRHRHGGAAVEGDSGRPKDSGVQVGFRAT